jgi:hypothetical protein
MIDPSDIFEARGGVAILTGVSCVDMGGILTCRVNAVVAA